MLYEVRSLGATVVVIITTLSSHVGVRVTQHELRAFKVTQHKQRIGTGTRVTTYIQRWRPTLMMYIGDS